MVRVSTFRSSFARDLFLGDETTSVATEIMFLANDIAAIAKLGEITPVNTVEFIDLFSEALIYRLKSSAGQGKRKQDASTNIALRSLNLIRSIAQEGNCLLMHLIAAMSLPPLVAIPLDAVRPSPTYTVVNRGSGLSQRLKTFGTDCCKQYRMLLKLLYLSRVRQTV